MTTTTRKSYLCILVGLLVTSLLAVFQQRVDAASQIEKGLPMGATVLDARPTSVKLTIDNPTRPTLFFVFQPFCPYCKQVAPIIARLHKELGADMDFVMVTDYLRYSLQSAEFRRQFGLTMPLLEDANLDFAKYKINGYPNFLWSVPGKPVVNWGPVGYDEKAWAWRDLPRALRLEKYGEPPTKPGAPVVKLRTEVGVVDVSWSAPSAASTAPIKHYEVEVIRDIDDVSVAIFGVEAVSATIRVPDAQLNQRYWIGVRAVSDAGKGANSTWVSARWTSPVSKPTSVTCQRRAVTRTFESVSCPRGWRKAG
jgi:thiol-disulfide isomerase/thioredoxin